MKVGQQVHAPFICAGVILASLTSRLDFVRRQLAAVAGVYWRGDHTFRAASRIRSPGGNKEFAAIYSVMNEWSQIVAQYGVGDLSFNEYVTGLQAVARRYAALGYTVSLCESGFRFLALFCRCLSIEEVCDN